MKVVLSELLPDGGAAGRHPIIHLTDGCAGGRLLPPGLQTLAFIFILSAAVQSRQQNHPFSLQTRWPLELCLDAACTCARAHVCPRSAGLTSVPTGHQQSMVLFSLLLFTRLGRPSALCVCLSSESSRCVQVPAASWPRPPAARLSPLTFSFHYDAGGQYLEKAEDPISASAHRKQADSQGRRRKLTTPIQGRPRP